MPWLRTPSPVTGTASTTGHCTVPADSRAPYDPNIDIVTAAIYGAVPVTEPGSGDRRPAAQPVGRPVLAELLPDQRRRPPRGIGPLLGRCPGDTYDGDNADAPVRDHPWAVSTANFAELYYRLAKQVTTAATVPLDNLSAEFFGQIEVDASTAPEQAAATWRARRPMLRRCYSTR